MKKIIRLSWVNSIVWVALCAIMFSFSSRPGAHSFQVYLDDKMVVDQYARRDVDAPRISIDPSANYSQLIVKYSECGRTVTGRKLMIKDEKNTVLKEWNFEGSSTGFKESMACKVKDLFAVKPKSSNTLKLYYSSNDFQAGMQVAYLILSGEQKTAANR